MMRVIVLTSDKYLHALRPFAWLFNKYWSSDQPVLVAGFTPPDFSLPGNFDFHSIGLFADYPVQHWSDAVIKLLRKIEDEAFVLMLEDYWLTRPVNTQAVQMCHDYLIQFKNVLKIDLCSDRLYAKGAQNDGHCGYLDLIKSDPNSEYHMSLMTGVWRRDNLLRVLIPSETPWQIEIAGTARLRQVTDLDVLGTRQYPIQHILAYRSGKPGKVSFGESGICHGALIGAEDEAYIRAQGWV
jgi:hypothetical protein